MSGWESVGGSEIDTETIARKYQKPQRPWVAPTTQAVAIIGFFGAIAAAVLGAHSLLWHAIGVVACFIALVCISFFARTRAAVSVAPLKLVITANVLTSLIVLIHAYFLTRRLL